MAAKTATSLFYSRGGYLSGAADATSKMYVAPADVKDTYLPQALKMMNGLLGSTKTIALTFTDTDGTTGDLTDDMILAEFACYYRDLDYGTRRYDPETKSMSNRHREEGMTMFLDAYGVMNSHGKLVAPCYAEDSDQAYSAILVTCGDY
jgi:hypothetical protein